MKHLVIRRAAERLSTTCTEYDYPGTAEVALYEVLPLLEALDRWKSCVEVARGRDCDTAKKRQRLAEIHGRAASAHLDFVEEAERLWRGMHGDS